VSDISVWVACPRPLATVGQMRPLLAAHDGTMYADHVGLPAYARARGADVALLDPAEDRQREYAANPAYASALVHQVLPRLALGRPVIGVGASLGGLAMLHAHRLHPAAFAGLFLQSGSFFDQLLDPQEADRFPYFRQVTAFVATVLRNDRPVPPVPVVITCGRDEENLANNRQLAAALSGQGYPVTFVEVPGGHHHSTWAASLDPALGVLLRTVRSAG
jgi:enterochelin esterase-like enzyme